MAARERAVLVIDPRRDPLLKAALATILLGFDAQKLFAFDQNDQERQTWLDRFSDWRTLWVDGCFMAMFRNLAVTQDLYGVGSHSAQWHVTEELRRAGRYRFVKCAFKDQSPDMLCLWIKAFVFWTFTEIFDAKPAPSAGYNP